MTTKRINPITGLFEDTFGVGTFSRNGKPVPTLVRADGQSIDLSDTFYDTHQIFDDWDRNFDVLVDLSATGRADFEFAKAEPLKPLAHPNLMCAGSNYKQHVAEMLTKNKFNQHNRKPGESDEDFFQRNYEAMEERARTGTPFLWAALHSSLVGANDDVVLPVLGNEPDWEMELGCVIGKSARHATLEEAEKMIAGYIAVNDIGTVDIFRRTDVLFQFDWISKHQPTFKVAGPFVVPRQMFEIDDDIRITLQVNDKVMQDWPVTDMIFSLPQMVAYLSERINLTPGDMILSGSPPGNGKHHGQFLKDADLMVGAVTGLGQLTNTCRQEPTPDRPLAFGLWADTETDKFRD